MWVITFLWAHCRVGSTFGFVDPRCSLNLACPPNGGQVVLSDQLSLIQVERICWLVHVFEQVVPDGTHGIEHLEPRRESVIVELNRHRVSNGCARAAQRAGLGPHTD